MFVRLCLVYICRQAESFNEKYAYGIVNLVFYIYGLTECFPRDVLSLRSLYVDIAKDAMINNADKQYWGQRITWI